MPLVTCRSLQSVFEFYSNETNRSEHNWNVCNRKNKQVPNQTVCRKRLALGQVNLVGHFRDPAAKARCWDIVM